jgi:hypothetical protein
LCAVQISAHSAFTLSMPRNRNCAPSCLFDLSEHRLDYLLSEPVAASPPGAFQLVPHGLGERAAALSFGLGGMLAATGVAM